MTNFRVFDIHTRTAPSTLAARWLPEKREIFLLDEAVLNPLSVDDEIWPKMPSAGVEQGVRVAILADSSMPTLVADNESNESAVTAQWPLLGYDVADAWQVSGLTNCGYSPEEKTGLVEVWKPRLNERGLLGTLAWANEFVAVANGRVLEHAPFFVYELRSPDMDRSIVVAPRNERVIR